MTHTTSSQTKVFYGWWLVAAGTLVLIVSSGVGFYTHGVILDPLCSLHNWSKGTVSAAITLYFLTTGIMGFFIGRQIDRHGTKPMLVIGSLVMGLGFNLLSRVSEVWQLFLVYFIMAIGWSGTSLVPITALIAQWFVRRRGLAMGLTMTGLSLGGIVMVPLAVWVNARWGLSVTLPMLGATFWVVIIPTALWVVKRRPADLGLLPDGDPPEVSCPSCSTSCGMQAAQTRVWRRSEAMGTLAFWAIVISFFLALSGQNSFLVHQISFLGKYLGRSGAATAVSLTALASVFGRLALGAIVDRLNNRRVAMACFLVQGLAVLALAYNQHIVVLYLGTLAFGLTMGNIIMMQSLIIGECFGMVSFGTVSGTVGIFSVPAAAFGPVIAGWLFDATGSYHTAFIIFAAASAVAAVTVLFARPPK